MEPQVERTQFPSSGGSGTLRIATNRECAWSAKSQAGWLTLSTPSDGRGEGTISFAVAANQDPVPRSGGININDQEIRISQEGKACEFRLSSIREIFAAPGGDRTIEVTASSGQCEWSAQADQGWLEIVAGRQGKGSGAVTFRVGALSGASRTGTLTIAGAQVQVEQTTAEVPSPAACIFVIGPVSFTFGASGGAGEVGVTTSSGCVWTAESNAGWISITNQSAGTGSGNVSFRVAATNGPARSGFLKIADQIATIDQGPGCDVSVNPATYSAPAAGGTSAVTVSTAAGCAWTTSTSAAWIVVTSGSTGSGPGRVEFSVSANTGPERTGSLAVGGRTITVTQPSGCDVTVSPTSYTAPVAGGTSAVTVSTGNGCAWSAATGTAWIAISGPSSGSGPGRVDFSVPANTGPERSGSLVISGKTVSVTQPSGCRYEIAPSSHDAPATGDTRTVAITTASGCPWSATSSVNWVTPSTTTGVGPGQVQLAVAINSGPPRAGTVTIAGRPFTVNQASLCTFMLNPSASSYDANGGEGLVLLFVTGACTWTAVSNAEWIRVNPDSSSGAGSGFVRFTVATSAGPARTGTVVIAGVPHTVTQAAR